MSPKSPKRMSTSRRRSGASRGSSAAASVSSMAAGPAAPPSANIRVAVRVRPENSKEKAGGFRNVIDIVDHQMLVFDPKEEEDVFYFHGKKEGRRDLNKRASKDKKFAFDAVFGPGSTNEDVFEGTTKDLVDTVFNGYNSSVFAYGATGAGKTFTMLGCEGSPGITFMTMKEVFNRMESCAEEKSCEIAISYLEIYNETVHDLLTPSGVLNIREDGKAGVNIPGLSLHKPGSPAEVLGLLSYGNSNRTQHPTDANAESSRSHAVLQVFLKQKNKDAGLSAEVKIAKLSLIDLAGSEKGGVTGAKGARFREGSNINKSLLALGNCINALADGAKYIPYRNSKLTRLLKDSIGGNCRTVMVANVSPSSQTFEDTFNTLKYADRAKKIKINLKKNVVNVDFHIAQYAKIVEDLKGDINVLKEKIKTLETENEALRAGGAVPMEGISDTISTIDGSVEESRGEKSKFQGNSEEIEEMKSTLDRLIQRQHDYDSLQKRVAEYKRKDAEQKETIKQLREGGVNGGSGGASGNSLDGLVEKRRELVEALRNEEGALATLKMRVHFKERAVLRSNLINLTQNSLEKSNVKNAKGIESLSKKIERKEEKRSNLLKELHSNQITLDSITNSNPDEANSKIALLQVALMDKEAESSHLHNLINTMGGELDKTETGLMSCLPILKQNHMMCRAHEIASKDDQGKFDEMVGQLTGNKVSWSEGSRLVTTSDEMMSATNIYAQVSRLQLPTLMHVTSSRPSSAEQRSLFGPDDDISNEQFENGVNMIGEEFKENVVEAEPLFPPRETAPVIADDDVILATPQLERQNSGQLRRLAEMTADSSFLETPPAFSLCSNTPLVVRSDPETTTGSPYTSLPSQADTQTIHPLSKRSITPTFPELSQMSGSASGTPTMQELSVDQLREACQNNLFALQSGSRSNTPDIPSGSRSNTPVPGITEEHCGTPKRPAERAVSDDDSPLENKRLRLDETYVPVEPTWTQHREVEVMPVTPVIVKPNMDHTFDADNDGGASPGAGCGNETITLVAKLGEQCDLGSPMEAPAPQHNGNLMNSTFAIEGIEPMEVDPTVDLARMCPDMSIIVPPASLPLLPSTCSGSPVKAGLGLSPAPNKRPSTPSPLRTSTMLDLKEGTKSYKPVSVRKSPRNNRMGPPKPTSTKKKSGPTPSKLGGPITPQPVRRSTVKRSLSQYSQSTSNLPKVGPHPVSMRSTIQRLQDQDGAGVEVQESSGGARNYMTGTTASKNKAQGGLGGASTLDRNYKVKTGSTLSLNVKENPRSGAESLSSKTKGFSSMSSKIGTGFGKLKKSVSNTVLKQNNKQ